MHTVGIHQYVLEMFLQQICASRTVNCWELVIKYLPKLEDHSKQLM